MDDAVRATLALMEVDENKLSVRTSYNLSAISFSPLTLVAAIKMQVPGFSVRYAPDFRQKIADSWPDEVDDSRARNDWGWKPQFALWMFVPFLYAQLNFIDNERSFF